MRRRSNEERRLTALRVEVPKLREQLRVLDEQLAYVEEVADSARVRALVSSSPLDAREQEGAEQEVRRTRAQRDQAAVRLEEVLAEQDRLLERMLDRVQGDST
jgi:hypothetical protein